MILYFLFKNWPDQKYTVNSDNIINILANYYILQIISWI